MRTSGRTVMPGASRGTRNALMPLCLGTSGLVRASTRIQCAYCAPDVHTFHQPAPPPAVLLGPRHPHPARRVHGLLPRAPLLERLAVGRHAIVGGVVEAEIGGQVGGEPVTELAAKRVVLGSPLEIHDP